MKQWLFPMSRASALSVLLPDLPGMLGWDSSHLYSSGTLSVIPEPTTLPLLALGLLLAWRRR